MVTRLVVLLLLVVGVGCPRSDSQDPSGGAEKGRVTEPVAPARLRVLVVDDPDLAAVIARQIASVTAHQMEVVPSTSDELAVRLDRPPSADLIVFPTPWLGTLAQRRWIAPVPASVLDDPEFSWKQDVLPVVRQHETRWGNDVYALPLGSAHFHLLYRGDLFERHAVQVPRTWGELSEAAQLLQAAVDDPVQWSVVEPLAAGWAGKTLLARAAPYARQRSRYSTLFDFQTMEPLIDQPPFVRALEELVALHQAHAEQALSWTVDTCRQMLYDGRCAVALAWPAAWSAEQEQLTTTVPFGVASCPGSAQWYNSRTASWEARQDDDQRVPLLSVAGRLVAVGRRTEQAQAAWGLAVTLTGERLAGAISARSRDTAPARAQQLAAIGLWLPQPTPGGLAQQYAGVLETFQHHNSYLHSLRLPGFGQYQAALDDAVRQALLGERTAADALGEAAERWRQITRAMGLPSQTGAYQMSLGLEM